MASASWRLLFVVAAVLLAAGGRSHPRGTIPEMLQHPDWTYSHSVLLAGYVALLGGVLAFGRTSAASAVRSPFKLALVGTILQVVEAVAHLAAVVDVPNLVAGRSTPVLNTHLALSVVCYPAFGLTFAAFIVAAARERAAGSRWIAWLGVLGLMAHGAAPPVALTTGYTGLFPLLMLFAVWLVLAAVWPARQPTRHAEAAV